MIVFRKIFFLLVLSFTMLTFSQENKKTWKSITQSNDESWFESTEAKNIAENVLLYQREIGGWPKNIQMQDFISDVRKQELIKLKSNPDGCTIDNGSTCQEMIFLSKVYKKQPDERYKTAFLKGVLYLISAQYSNGGWPQYYPLKKGYYSHITFNDDAMVNVLKIFEEIKDKSTVFSIAVPEEIVDRVEEAYNNGINCILKTQVKQKGKLTAWCAQHDRESLEPAQARAYELPSLSGKESAKITLLLMSIKNPSKEIKNSIEAAVCWFEKTKIEGIKIETITTGVGDEKDKVVVKDQDAEPIWARFMELKDNKPFFCDRDGIKKATLAEIGIERRNGYGWYTNEPKEVLKKYQGWKDLFNK